MWCSEAGLERIFPKDELSEAQSLPPPTDSLRGRPMIHKAIPEPSLTSYPHFSLTHRHTSPPVSVFR